MTCTTTCTRAPHRHALCMLVLPLLSCVVCPAESALGGSGGPAVSRPCPAAARAGAQEERKQENKATAPSPGRQPPAASPPLPQLAAEAGISLEEHRAQQAARIPRNRGKLI